MGVRVSRRMGRISDSPTLAVSSMAREMRSRGIDVVDFGAGQPDFQPPEYLKEAAIEAVHSSDSKYTAVPGLLELRQAVCNKLRRDNRIECGPENVIITAGAKHGLYNLFQAILDPGEEVIIPRPYWVSYPEMVRLAEGKPVFAGSGPGFSLDPDAVMGSITERTRAIVLNSPNNPSGAVFTASAMKKVAREASSRGIFLVSDEIYEKIIYGKSHFSPASIGRAVRDVTFTVNGLSKSHAITGWRLGYVAGPEEVIRSMAKLQSQSTSNPCSIVQRAALAALDRETDLSGVVAEYRKRRDFLVDGLNSLDGFSCSRPEGAFYVLPRIPAKDDAKFSGILLQKANVAVVPGSAFGVPGHIRISYATPMEQLRKGMERISIFINSG
jgi:aspartate aminotransferase